MLAEKTVLITGAGGSIGSALTRLISNSSAKKLLLLDVSEHGLYSLDQELQREAISVNRELVIGSVQDQGFVRAIFKSHMPQIVFHAAAYKHVPLMESNPFAAIETNVFGTQVVANASSYFSAEQFVLLSTDKAVDPASIMGASKRLAELIVSTESSETSMKALRLCNVLGSSGSVAQLFYEQAKNSRPLTVTHAEASRYFVSACDARQYLMEVADARYSAGLYIPPVTKPHRIQDLAKFITRFASAAPETDHIVYTGLRPGEKLHEKMTSDREVKTSGNGSLMQVNGSNMPFEFLQASFEQIRAAVTRRDLRELIEAVRVAVPEYTVSDELLNRCAEDR